MNFFFFVSKAEVLNHYCVVSLVVYELGLCLFILCNCLLLFVLLELFSFKFTMSKLFIFTLMSFLLIAQELVCKRFHFPDP